MEGVVRACDGLVTTEPSGDDSFACASARALRGTRRAPANDNPSPPTTTHPMSQKKTDMTKGLARKLQGQQKGAGVPARFGGGSAAAMRGPKPPPAPERLLPLACRLPANLLEPLRERAVGHEGGINALLAAAVAQWLAAQHA